MQRSRAIFASILSLVLAASSVTPAFAATRSQLNQHRQAAQDARRKAEQADALAQRLAREVAELDGRIDTLQREADALDPQIAQATKRTTRLRIEVGKLRGEVRITQRRIDETQAEFDRQRTLLAARVNSAYRQGDWFYLDLLLGSSDFNDLIARTDLVTRVIRSNNDIAADLDDTKDSLERSRVKLERTLKAVSLKRREAESVEAELRGLQDARQAKTDEQEAIQGQKTELMQDSRANAARLRALAEEEERESDKIAAELAKAGHGSGVYAGTMAWPVPSSHRVTSPFGPRICPFHGRELHPGIDIGRASADGPSLMGAPIVAAGGGTVIYAGYRGGYGNTVMIDHGNGVVTLYAHQAGGGITVSSGQNVSVGQRIGTVGSTGNSTGPHLHFEVRINGTPTNPMNYM
ncbi:MAG: hypothetical protein FDZ75_03740 [Actinobacteria bacterium]|nr:MAG: hypothetical protein FDZ75_03740 [Actinomycetota bacterium]